MRKLKLFFACLLMAVLSIGQMWATTYKLTKVTSVEAGKLYVFERNSHVFNNTSSSSALQTTATYNTSGLEGTESYVWTLESATGGFYLKNVSLASNQYLNNASKTTVSFGAASSIWTIAFTGEVALISNTSNSNRFLGDAGKESPNNTYKAYATSNLNDYQHDITVYVLDEEGSTPPTPAKTLVSVAVSGTPTKTSYYAGDNFDPAGLTVTGTYNDESTAPITSGITWAYNPSQELALNQTSIGVTATVSEITSAEYPVSITVSEAPAAVNYEKVTAEPTDWSGDYILVYEADATNARVWKGADQANNYAEATIANGVIAAPDDAAVLTIAKVAESDPVVYTIQVGTKYIGQTSNSNGIKIQDAAINNSLSMESNGVGIVASEAHLRYNSASSSYFRYYKSSTYTSQNPIQLYKKVDGTVKPSAELSYATADQKKLTKLGEAFTAPTLVNPHEVAVTYASDNTDVATVAADGAVTIKAVGVATITASYDGSGDYKEGSASYTIGVTAHAGTESDPYAAADVKIAIDAKGTVENAYATGIVSNVVTTTLPAEGYISFYFSADGLTAGQQVEAYKCYGLNSAPFEAVSDVVTGATVVVTGNLKKFNSTYEFDQNCHLVSYTAPAAPKTHIANTKETAYTVAQALVYAADGVTYDLDDYVYVQGVVYDVKSFNNGVMDIYIKDAGQENQFELYKCAGINDGSSTTPFEALTDVQTGNIVIGYGQLTVYNTMSEFKQGNYLVDLQKPVTGVQLDQTEASVEEEATVTLTATIMPSNATGTIVWSVESGDTYASVDENGVVTGIAEGEAVIRATVQGTEIFAECTVTVTAKSTPDTRHIANSPATFTAVSGDMTPNDITFAANQGGAGTAPGIYNSGIRLYQAPSASTIGGYITLTAKAGCTIDEVQITTTSTYATTVTYSVDGNETLLKSENVAKSGSYTTGTGLNVQSVNIVNKGTSSSGRLEIASIKVYYTGEPASIHHYVLGGTYQTAFMQGDEFNHTGLIVYAAYDELEETKVDITSMCTFSEPDMSTTGDKTIEITYNEAVVTSYTINVAADSRKVANSPATFTTVSGDMTPADITFASYQGGAGTAPATYNDGIRLYQAPSESAIGGFITLKAKKGCTIDQVKITTTNTYATTVAYSVDGNENLLGSESVAKSGEYTTPSGLNKESVNIVNKGTGSNGRLEIASIKVWYTGDALPVHHYILGGTYATEFEQYGEFNFEGLTVTAAYDELETITEAVTGFTVEADLNTAGAAKANVMLNSVKIAEYDITVTASAKTDPALAYNPASVILTLGQSLTAPAFSNDYNVSPITYNSDKKAVATVDAEGNIALAGGTGTAVITASFAGDDEYIASEATFTITVNEPAEDLSGTWVVATSIAAGDRIIIGATVGEVTKTMGLQNTNNRAAVTSTLADGVLTPGEGTKTFLVVNAGDGKFALQALNGKYLTSATSGTGNNLLEAANYENDNAKWTIEIDGEGVASVVAAAGNRKYMKYNNGSTLFSCYQYETSQSPINIYKKGAAPEPVVTWTPIRSEALEIGRYYTVCLNKAIAQIDGASFWSITYGTESLAYLEEEIPSELEPLAAGKPFIFLTTSAEPKVVLTGDEVGTPVANGALRGTLVGLSASAVDDIIAADGDIYMLQSNALHPVTAGNGNYLASNRAYVLKSALASGNPAPGRNVRTMPLQGQTATGIDALNAADAPVKVMINGQLFILRGEKMFDATGRLVK